MWQAGDTPKPGECNVGCRIWDLYECRMWGFENGMFLWEPFFHPPYSSQLWPRGLVALRSSWRATGSTFQPCHHCRRAKSSQCETSFRFWLWSCCCLRPPKSWSAGEIRWIFYTLYDLVFISIILRQWLLAESSALVSKLGVPSSDVLWRLNAQHDHPFRTIQVFINYQSLWFSSLGTFFPTAFNIWSSRSVLSSASQLAVLNMEGNFGTFLTDDFFLDLLNRNRLNKLATLDISFNDQGGVGTKLIGRPVFAKMDEFSENFWRWAGSFPI